MEVHIHSFIHSVAANSPRLGNSARVQKQQKGNWLGAAVTGEVRWEVWAYMLCCCRPLSECWCITSMRKTYFGARSEVNAGQAVYKMRKGKILWRSPISPVNGPGL